MSARELAMVRTRRQLHTAAIGRARVRIRGWWGLQRHLPECLLADRDRGSQRAGDGEPSTPLGTVSVGSTVELAARLTGMVDVAAGVFHAERAQLLTWAPGTD